MKKKIHHKTRSGLLYGISFVVLLFSTLFLLSSFSSPSLDVATQDYGVRHDIKLAVPSGGVIYAEVANTSSSRELGLSFRKRIRDDEGMLFIFDTPGKYGFWMKDMQFPIDIAWLSPEGQVIHLEENVATSTYPDAFSNSVPAQYVLELPQGMARTYKIYLGTKIDVRSVKNNSKQ